MPTAHVRTSLTGQAINYFTVSWTNPADVRYAGVNVYYINPGISSTQLNFLQQVPYPANSASIQFPAPNSSQTWDIVLLAFDVNGNQDTYDPGVTPIMSVTVGTTGGTLDLSNTIPGSVGNGIGVSGSQLGFAGTATIGASQAMTLLSVKNGGSSIGFIGSDGLGHVGIWGGQLWVGGSGPANAPLYVDGSGNVHLDATLGGGTVTIVGGTMTLNANTITTNLNNANDTLLGVPVGLSVNNNSVAGQRVLIHATGISIFKSSSAQSIFMGSSLGYGDITLYDASSSLSIELNGGNGNVKGRSLTGDLWSGTYTAGTWTPGATATGYVPLYNGSGTLVGKIPYY